MEKPLSEPILVKKTKKKILVKKTPSIVETPIGFDITKKDITTPLRNDNSPTPANTPSKEKKEKIKNLILDVQSKKRKIEDIDNQKFVINEKMEKLKKEVYSWMNRTGQKKVLWNNRSIHQHQCLKLKRTEPSDVLEIVAELYSEEVLQNVIQELGNFSLLDLLKIH